MSNKYELIRSKETGCPICIFDNENQVRVCTFNSSNPAIETEAVKVLDGLSETATLHAQIARLKQREGELEMLLEGGAGRIARERHRHVTQEGYDSAHDDEHTYGTIRVVAAMLACNGTDASVSDPLDRDDWNLGRHPLERRLEIAGALLAAELDRLARAALQSLRALTEQPGKP